VSLYLSFTALSSLISSYFGGWLLNYLSVQQMFMVTSIFSLMTFASGIIVTETKRTKQVSPKPCFHAEKNWTRVWSFLKLPFIYLPTIFIFLVVLAPGCDDAMFYFNTNVLHFTNTELAWSNVLCSVSNILGVWGYRLFFSKTPFKKMLFITTVAFSVAQMSKLILSQQVTEAVGLSPIAFTYINQIFYTFVNELHLMPLMVLAAKMCPKQVEATFYAFVLAVINLGYLVSYQLGGLLTYGLGITSSDFQSLWILILIASVFPLLTQLFLFCLPEKYDVNEEIAKYFQQRREQKELKRLVKKGGSVEEERSIDVESLHTGSIRLKSNIRDDIGEGDYLIDHIVLDKR
jgi:hypothetical protein